jgi:putative transposase
MARWLGGYARYYCRKYETAGHIWQGRFRSQPIQKEIYLLRCGRYVERNAYRAGIVKRPWDYEWSSCKVYALGINDGLTEQNVYYRAFGTTDGERQSAYRKWLMGGEDEIFKGAERFAGDEQFASHLALSGSRLIARRNGRPMQCYVEHK